MSNGFELPELPAVKDKNKQTPGSGTRDDGRLAAASRQGEEGRRRPQNGNSVCFLLANTFVPQVMALHRQSHRLDAHVAARVLCIRELLSIKIHPARRARRSARARCSCAQTAGG